MADAVLPTVADVLGTGSNIKGENVPVHVTSIRLNKDNYLSWFAALEIGITSRGRLQYITGEKPAPAKNDPQWATWTLEDSQGDSSVASFYAALKTKWEELDYHTNDDWKNASDQALYWEKEWMDRTFIFLGGLHDEFESIRSQLLNCDEVPGIEEVYARVEAEEQRRQIMHIDSSHGSSPTAFVSRTAGTGQRPSRRCSHCNKLGHSVDFSWDLHPEKRLVRGRPPSTRRAPSVPEPSRNTASNVATSKLSADQLKELQAYIIRLSTQDDASTSEGARLAQAQALVATSDPVSEERDGQMEGSPVVEQSRDHLFGQVYSRKEKNVMEVVDVTNPNPARTPDDPSPMNEDLLIALRKGTRDWGTSALRQDGAFHQRLSKNAGEGIEEAQSQSIRSTKDVCMRLPWRSYMYMISSKAQKRAQLQGLLDRSEEADLWKEEKKWKKKKLKEEESRGRSKA
ncbi:hypothetical protein EJ110_NYTH43082 [Nymphaea thermarum]|nr:hypothetical protein EJ110_NYTH43082 [Nymphaea thermarum]